jgi:hypothetical protein
LQIKWDANKKKSSTSIAFSVKDYNTTFNAVRMGGKADKGMMRRMDREISKERWKERGNTHFCNRNPENSLY